MRPSHATSEEEVPSRGFTIRCLAAGPASGEVLLLVHGVLQSAARWAEMGYLDALSDDRRVIAVDLLGHGASDKPVDPAHYDLDGQLADLMAVLDTEGATTFDVWGYSGAPLLPRRWPTGIPNGSGPWWQAGSHPTCRPTSERPCSGAGSTP